MTTRLVHSTSDAVQWSASRKSLVASDGKRLKGLLSLLQSNFYPHYSYQAATLDGGDGKPIIKLAKGDKKIRGGMNMGRRLDRSVQQSIQLLRTYHVPVECMWERKDYLAASKAITVKTHKLWLKQIFNSNTSKHKSKSPYVKLFWQTMRDLKLRPMATQVAVRHSKLPMGTLADVVCQDNEQRYHVVELKTGFEKYYYKHTPIKMSYPFGEQNDCPHNQHQLQLTATHEMYRQTFPAHKVGDPLLLRFHSAGVHVVPRKPWAASATDEMFKMIRER